MPDVVPDTVAGPSASPPVLRPHVIAVKLRPEWEQDGSHWSLDKLEREVRKYFPGAPRPYCVQVQRSLVSSRSSLDDKQQNDLLQGYAACLQLRGWAVSLLGADGSTVLMQAVDMEAAKFAAKERKSKADVRDRITYNVQAAIQGNLNTFPDIDVTGTPCTYSMGYLVVPPQHTGFQPWRFHANLRSGLVLSTGPRPGPVCSAWYPRRQWAQGARLHSQGADL